MHHWAILTGFHQMGFGCASLLGTSQIHFLHRSQFKLSRVTGDFKCQTVSEVSHLRESNHSITGVGLHFNKWLEQISGPRALVVTAWYKLVTHMGLISVQMHRAFWLCTWDADEASIEHLTWLPLEGCNFSNCSRDYQWQHHGCPECVPASIWAFFWKDGRISPFIKIKYT